MNSGTLVALLSSQPHGAPSEFFRYRPGISTGSLPALDYSGVVMIDNGVVHTGMIEKAPVCTIQGIRVTTKKEGDKYYLVRDPVQNAKLYSVYSARTNDIRMRKKLTDTTDTKYEYPFDYQAKENVYAYFWVEAICDDGQTLDLAGATKVHVGPLQDFLLLVFISLLIYSGIKLYRYGE